MVDVPSSRLTGTDAYDDYSHSPPPIAASLAFSAANERFS